MILKNGVLWNQGHNHYRYWFSVSLLIHQCRFSMADYLTCMLRSVLIHCHHPHNWALLKQLLLRVFPFHFKTFHAWDAVCIWLTWIASVLNVSFNVKRLYIYKTRLNCTAISSWRQMNYGPVTMLLSFFGNIFSCYPPFPSTACQLHANNLPDLSGKAFYM